jgi:hypothetical protein
LRHIMVELAWLWVRHQPDSALTGRFRERVGAETGRVRRIAFSSQFVHCTTSDRAPFWRMLARSIGSTGSVKRAAAI